MRGILNKILGDQNTKTLRRLEPLVGKINDLEPGLKKLSDSKLKAKTNELKKQLSAGKTLDDILPEAFGVVREAARRTLNQRHFDVQLLGGIVLHQGNIAEMGTGEGKTLVATLPIYLNALTGAGVHLVTVNDYLAQRDAGWMAEIYHFLGLSVGVIVGGNISLLYDPEFSNEEHDDERLRHLRPVPKKQVYAADIVYGTNNEFGFDYLRDNMARSKEEISQRGLVYAIVDEVDSILIDEARTPLIISAPAADSSTSYQQFSQIARSLNKDEHYLTDEKVQAANLTDAGVSKVEEILGIKNLYDTGSVQLVYHLEQALKAQALFKRDKDYVVRDGEVIIVDEFTGRLLAGRRYSEGLHQAIEAKEGVSVLQESQTLATISFQNYFRLYQKLAGMTGTAKTEAEEFQNIYNLDVLAIPPNRPNARLDLPDRIYKTETAKFKAIAAEVQTRHTAGQPVLLGTVSIEKNEALSKLLHELKVPHEVLNAKNNEQEATIVSEAGQKRSVTLATNIAGRGTDIVLGKGVVELGGLLVIGSERHESRRIDNQLRGRAGRQGDPGATQFYVSLEDDLMRIFGGERIASVMNTLRIEEDVPIENAMVSKALESAQKKVESHNFDIRKTVVQYDDVMNRHRETIYGRRRKILENQNLREDILQMVYGELGALVRAHIDVRTEELETDKLLEIIQTLMPLDKASLEELRSTGEDKFLEAAKVKASALYDSREKKFGTELMRAIERAVYLQILDRLWMEHLENMSHMREGIGLRAIGQRDPLTEYKKEAFELFNGLIAGLEHEVAITIFKVAPEPVQTMETELTQAADQATITSGGADSDKPTKTTNKPVKRGYKVGRNDPCPCGSGLKYKKCGLINSPEHKG